MLTPIRDLGSAGVLSDIDPFASKINQFNFASNVRFENGTIQRGPVFGNLGVISNGSPRFLMSYSTLANVATFNVCNKDGTITNWVPGGFGSAPTETDISIGGYTPSNYDHPYTATVINDVIYVNRPDRVPWFKTKSGSSYTAITTGSDWDATWRCQSLRSIAGVLVALNVTKGATSYPTMVKTSDYMLFDTIPGTWVAGLTNSATENVLPDLQEPLVDGLPHRDRLILYTQNETWLMEPRYDSLMFNYRRLFTNAGVLSQNCVAEWNNVHYVFGTTDIWMHDGFTRKSIAFGSVRDFIYTSMDRNYTYLFFTIHQPRNNEIMFCYVSQDPYCVFPVGGAIGTPGCNRAAVFNYANHTWTFYDLPYLTGAGLGVPVTGTTYTGTDPTSYDGIIGSYSSFSDTSRVTMVTTGMAVSGVNGGNLTCQMRSYDRPTAAGVNGILDSVATAPVLLLNDVIDMDDFGANIRDYKWVKSIYPQGITTTGANPLVFDWGAADFSSNPPAAYSGNPQSFDGSTLYKLDYRMTGRFLSMKMTYDDWRPFSLSGFDFEWDKTGTR